MIDPDFGMHHYYKHMVNWERRLGKEGPFLVELFNKNNAKKVLDAGCGVGRHTLYLRSRGIEADGSDVSEKNIKEARHAAQEQGVDAKFFVEDMEKIPSADKTQYDAVMSLGNPMAAFGKEKARRTLKRFADVLPKGGVAVIHVLNYNSFDKTDRTEPRWAEIDDTEMVFLKTFHFEDDHVTMIINVLARKDDGGWECALHSNNMYYLEKGFFAGAMKEAGFEKVEFYGGLNGSGFDYDRSRDLVVVGYR